MFSSLPPRKRTRTDGSDETIGKVDALLGNLGQLAATAAAAASTPTLTKPPPPIDSLWSTFGSDCAIRMSLLPKRVALQVRKNIEGLLIEAEMNEADEF